MLIRALAQTATVLMLARMLGANGYGQVVAVFAVASFGVPFAGLGLAHIVLRNSARDPAHEARYFSLAILWWKRTVLLCGLTVVFAAVIFIPTDLPIPTMTLAIVTEIAVTSLTELCARHNQALHRPNAYGLITSGLPLLRLIALFMWITIARDTSVAAVVNVYSTSGLVYILLLWSLVFRATVGATNESVQEPMTVTSGLSFSLSAFAIRMQGEFNKPVLARAGFDFAGSYNVAQRAVDLASLPLQAMQEALWPRLHAQANPVNQFRRTGLALTLLALVLAVSLCIAAPMLPIFLGQSYIGSVQVLRLLAWIPMLQTFRSLLNFKAIHLNKPHRIGWASIFGSLVSVAGVSVLVPVQGMKGAAIATFIAEIAMIIFLLASNFNPHGRLLRKR